MLTNTAKTQIVSVNVLAGVRVTHARKFGSLTDSNYGWAIVIRKLRSNNTRPFAGGDALLQMSDYAALIGSQDGTPRWIRQVKQIYRYR